MQKSLVKNSIFNIIYTVANILFPFVTSVYVSRILLPAGVGKVAAAQNLASYFVTLAALGLPSYGVREFAKVRDDEKRKNSLFTELITLNLISTTVAVVAYAAFLIYNNGFKGEWALYICCGLTICFNYLNIDWIYQGLEEYGYITVRSIVIKLLSLVLLFVFVRSRKDYVAYALLTSLALGGNYIFNMIHARKMVRFSFENLNIKRHIKPVLYIAGIIFMSTIYNKVDVTMLNVLATDEAIGFYATLLPRLSYCYENDKDGFYKLLDKGFQILCLAVGPLTIGLLLVADQAVLLLYGSEFLPSGLTIKLMCPLIIIKGFGDLLCYQLAYSSKNERILLPASALASVVNIIANAILIPMFAQNGAVIASVLSEFTTNIIQLIYLKKKVKYSFRLKSVAISVVSTTVMALVVAFAMRFEFPLIIAMFFEVLLGAVSYLVINIALHNQILYELLDKVKDKIKR